MQKPEAVVLPSKEYIQAVHETPTTHLEREASEAAEASDLSPYVFDLLVSRESGFKPSAAGDCSRGACEAHGVAQFHYKTFEWMKEKAGMPQLQYDNSHDQLILMAWAMSHHLQNQWGTFNRAAPELKKELLQ